MTCRKTGCCMQPSRDREADNPPFKWNPHSQVALLLSGAVFGVWWGGKSPYYHLPAQTASHWGSHQRSTFPLQVSKVSAAAGSCCRSPSYNPTQGTARSPVYASRAGHSSAGHTEQLYRRKWGKTLLIRRISWQEFACWRLQLETQTLPQINNSARCWGFLKTRILAEELRCWKLHDLIGTEGHRYFTCQINVKHLFSIDDKIWDFKSAFHSAIRNKSKPIWGIYRCPSHQMPNKTPVFFTHWHNHPTNLFIRG